MKKVVRTVWISLLTGLAFLVACTSPKGLTRAEKKQLKAERTELTHMLEAHGMVTADDPRQLMGIREDELNLRTRLLDIETRLGNKDGISQNNQRIWQLQSDIDSLRQVISDLENNVIQPCVYGPAPVDQPMYLDEKEQTRKELMDRLEVLQQTIKRREGACVYGSPEVIQRYGEETRRLKQEAKDIEKQLEELDNEK
jgi:hypothetical protein